MIVTAQIADKLIDRFGARALVIVALAALSAGYLLFLRVDPSPTYVLDVLPSVLLLGIGFGLGFPAIQVQATSGIANSEQGLAAGLVQSSSQVGAALVLAVTTALIAGGSGMDAAPSVLLDQFRPGLILSTAVAIAGLVVAVLPRRSERRV